jgi:hypothetical protein
MCFHAQLAQKILNSVYVIFSYSYAILPFQDEISYQYHLFR